MMPSVPQLLIILVIVVLIFGAKRLKNLGSDLGGAVKGFKQAVKDSDEENDGEPARLEDDKGARDATNTVAAGGTAAPAKASATASTDAPGADPEPVLRESGDAAADRPDAGSDADRKSA